jgi:hypothetical protein
MEKNKIEELLKKVYFAGIDGIEEVGYANYPEREAEAKVNLSTTYYEALEELENE